MLFLIQFTLSGYWNTVSCYITSSNKAVWASTYARTKGVVIHFMAASLEKQDIIAPGFWSGSDCWELRKRSQRLGWKAALSQIPISNKSFVLMNDETTLFVPLESSHKYDVL